MRMLRRPLLPLILVAIANLGCAQQPAPRTPPLVRADQNAPENASRKAVIDSLDALAAHETAARRVEIAKIDTLAQARARQAKVRATMLRLIGPLPDKTPLNPQVLGETQLDGFRIQKILFDSQPGFHVTALLYLPNAAAGKLPAIVIAPGHGATGKASDFASASTFARNGIAVLSYDPIGQGERLQYPNPADPTKSLATRPTGEHAEASLQPILLGESVARDFLWDGMRAVDYLLTRPEIDPVRIGAYGCSGGGAMTALLGALDTRIAAVGTACYITSFDTLLPSIGPQDGEQSTPGWIAAGLDFPDWVELAAPKPYALIATASDMFPYAGARASAAESRRFYALFDPTSAGTPHPGHSPGPSPYKSSGEGPPMWIPGEPTLNPDTDDTVSPAAPLQFIVGPGGHGNLRPLQPMIVQFFLTHLAHSTAAPILPPPPAPGANPFAAPAGLPPGALQVTTTGQVATAYPGSATVFSLNQVHAATLPKPKPLTLPQLQATIRQVTAASAIPGSPSPSSTPVGTSDHIRHRLHITTSTGASFDAEFYRPTIEEKRPVKFILRASLDASLEAARQPEIDSYVALAKSGTAVFVTAPRPSTPGTEEQKTPLLGEFYMLGLRAELAGKTLLGLRVDDVIESINFFVHGTTEDPNNITAEASGHDALVLLHAAVLDSRLKHITLTNLPRSYRDLLANPLPKDAPEDLLPGVLLHYDIPDLVHALGSRVTVVPPDKPVNGPSTP